MGVEFGMRVSIQHAVPHADVMTTEQVPAKKNHTVGNVAGIGVILALLGGFLIWRGMNLDRPSTLGFLLVLVAISFLLTALAYRYKR